MGIWDKNWKKELGVAFMASQKLKQCLVIVLLWSIGAVNATEINNVGFNVMPGDKVGTMQAPDSLNNVMAS